MSILLSIIAFILLFSGLIIIHEFGHYYAAIKSGVKVEEFGLGMGKKIYGKKFGETEFTFNLIPFGGFVRMLGEEEESKNPRSFGQAKLLNRMMITLGGPFMNFVTAFFIFIILFTVGTDPIIVSREDVKTAFENGQINYRTEKGIIISHEEKDQLVKGEKLQIVYGAKVKKDFPEVLSYSALEILRVSKAILQKVAEIPVQIIEKHALPEGLSGPVGIANITHKVVPLGFLAILKLMALLSISLGVMNLLPIPALDGGRFFFQLVEMILKPFGLKADEKWENYAHVIGFILLMGLLVAITWADIQRIFFS